MERGAAFLYAHVVALAQQLSVSTHKSGTNGHAALVAALEGFVEGSLEAHI